MERDALLDKLSKLLRLAGHRNTNPHEAANAAAAAQRIMLEHKISRAEVNLDDDAPMVVSDVKATSGGQRVVTWKLRLLNYVASNSFCRLTYNGGIMNVYGRRGDVDAVIYLYKYLEREIDRLAAGEGKQAQQKRAIRDYFGGALALADEEIAALDSDDLAELAREAGGQASRRWTNSFRLGAVHTIGLRLAQQRREQEASLLGRGKCTALIRRADAEVDAFLKRLCPHLRTVQRRVSVDDRAYASGMVAGRTVALNAGARLEAPAKQLRGQGDPV